MADKNYDAKTVDYERRTVSDVLIGGTHYDKVLIDSNGREIARGTGFTPEAAQRDLEETLDDDD